MIQHRKGGRRRQEAKRTNRRQRGIVLANRLPDQNRNAGNHAKSIHIKERDVPLRLPEPLGDMRHQQDSHCFRWLKQDNRSAIGDPTNLVARARRCALYFQCMGNGGKNTQNNKQYWMFDL